MKKLLFLTLIILFTGCSNEINRNDAEKLLIKEIGYPYVEYAQSKWNIWYFQNKGKYIVNNPKGRGEINLKNLVDKGLIDLSTNSRTVGYFRNRRTKSTYRYSLSSKSKSVLWDNNSLKTSFNYWIADLPINQINLKEVTGIKFEDDKKTKATIEYTENIIKTSPFSLLARKANRQNLIKRTAKAELYDDGWRITSNGLPNIKRKRLESVSGWNQLFENKKLKNKTVQKEIKKVKNKTYFKISVDNLRVRTSPNLDSEKIENLTIGSEVEFLEKSTNQSTVTIKNNEITEYWYKVKTPSGKNGWIHGCCFDK